MKHIFRFVGIAVVAGFLLSFFVPLPSQEIVPVAVRVLAFLAFLFCYMYFGSALATVDFLLSALRERKAQWPGPLSPSGTPLFRQLIVRTALMVVPLLLLVALIFPAILVGQVRPGLVIVWGSLVVGAILTIITHSLVHDAGVFVMTHLENTGVSPFVGTWKVKSVNRFDRFPTNASTAEFQATTANFLSRETLMLEIFADRTAHVTGVVSVKFSKRGSVV
jgi:hypothetical protein